MTTMPWVAAGMVLTALASGSSNESALEGWSQQGGSNRKCTSVGESTVADQAACQQRALDNNHGYYSYYADLRQCSTSAICDNPETGTGWAWKIYKAPTGAATIIKEAWVMKRGEYIKNWLPRYFVLRSDGAFLGYKQKPTSAEEWGAPENNYTIKRAQITRKSSPKPFTFVMRAFKDSDLVERTFAVDSSSDREDWITKLETVSRLVTELRKAKRTTMRMTLAEELNAQDQDKFTAAQRANLMKLVDEGLISIDIALRRLGTGRRRLNAEGAVVVYENTVTMISDNLDALPSTEELAQSVTKTASETPGLPEIDVDESSAKSEEVEVAVETDSEGNITIFDESLEVTKDCSTQGFYKNLCANAFVAKDCKSRGCRWNKKRDKCTTKKYLKCKQISHEIDDDLYCQCIPFCKLPTAKKKKKCSGKGSFN